ncbi:MAG TPA: DUF5666 domain-containing protein [Thermoanaerobaculia bacterium]|jgi:hypothetical protein
MAFVLVSLLVAAAGAFADDHGGGGTAETDLKGTVTALPAGGGVGDWTIAGRTVHVSAATRIEVDGVAAAIGSFAEARGTARADGSIDASRLEIMAAPAGGPAPQETRFIGAVEALPASGVVGDWKVAGKTVHVTAATKLETENGAPAVGGTVEVEGVLQADGSVLATSVETEEKAPGAGAPPEVEHAQEAEVRGAVGVLASGSGFIGDWTVAGTTVHVTAATTIRTEGKTLAIGSLVEVKGTKRADGTVDAARIELLWGPPNSGASLTSVAFVASTAHATGRAGAFFTTSLTLSNASSSSVTVEIRFHGHDRDGRGAPVSRMTLGPQETRTIDDVLGTLFGAASDFGSLAVASNSGALFVSSRTGTPGADGSFGQDIPAAGREDLVREGSSRLLAGVRQSSAFRTNLVVANAGEIDTDVEVELEDAAGTALGTARIALRPLEMRQLNDVARALGARDGFRDGRLRLSTPTANGAFAAFASEIDNGTNDPRTLWPR